MSAWREGAEGQGGQVRWVLCRVPALPATFCGVSSVDTVLRVAGSGSGLLRELSLLCVIATCLSC